MSVAPEDQKFGFVTIIGEPNAGKSTLMNHLVGAKVSIVSSKAQTTRTRVLGIVVEDKTQIVFVDTPGIFNPNQKNKMEKAIVGAAWDAVNENSDILLLMMDVSKRKKDGLKKIIEVLKKQPPQHTILVLNKVDKIKRETLLELSMELNELHAFQATFMISALKGNGVSDLLKYLSNALPQGIWHYPEDQMSDMPTRLLAAEITREKLFETLYQELPYNLTVETDEWENFNNGSIKIDQTIFVTRDQHKKIILGKGGAMIKKIGQQARQELEDILETTIHLKLFVKVQENWIDDKSHYDLWGLEAKK
jgi:GTP-binding protein Era